MIRYPCAKEKRGNHISHYIHIVNSKWIRDPNVKAKIIKYLGENIEANIHNLELNNAFLDMTPKAHQQKKKADKFKFIKIKNLKWYHQNNKDSWQNGTKYLQIIYLIKELYSEYIKNSRNNKK